MSALTNLPKERGVRAVQIVEKWDRRSVFNEGELFHVLADEFDDILIFFRFDAAGTVYEPSARFQERDCGLQNAS
jgi:hypothetical protein